MADWFEKFKDIENEGAPQSNFVHLHVHSDYSLLDGHAKVRDLVHRAKELNMPALALTDHGNMFGVLNFEHLCHANGINPIVGEEFYVAYGKHTEQEQVPYGRNGKHGYYFHLILLCKNDTGYKNMSWLSSIAYTDGFYKRPRIDFELLEKYHEGLICCSACIAGEIPQLLLNDRIEEVYEVAKKYQNLFGKDSYYIELQNHGLEDQIEVAPKLVKLAKDLDIPLVLTNDIHYVKKDDAEAQNALKAIGFKKALKDTIPMGGPEFYMKTESEMRQVLAGIPGIDDSVIQEAMDNTLKIASMCDLTIHQYSTPELKGTLPRFELPVEFQTHGDDYQSNQNDYVRHIVEEGLKKRYKEITPEIRARAEYEIGIIFSMGFSGYFLIVWEFINWSKSTYDNVNKVKKPYMPIGPGRGSGAGSLVAYCMGITDIDPFKFGLIFERFLNPERVSMPDFDVDMDFDFRQDIIKHTQDLYHPENVGHIVTFGTLKPKNCIADVGRILEIPLSEVNMLKACVPDNPKAKLKDCFNPPTEKMPDGGQLIPYKDDPRFTKLFELALKLEGCIRNTGLHASGMVIGLTPLPDWAPIFKDNRTGEVAVQYTMDIIEPCGLVKFDYLGLKTLSLIRYAEDIINKHRPEGTPEFSVSEVPDTDEETYKLFSRGDTVAIFQFESPGMQKWMRALQPKQITDLVAMNALYRPGPMDYIQTFVDGKNDPSTVKYPDPCLEGILKETYGVMVYQEQIMQVSQRIAGFSLGAADMLRRAMGKKKLEVLMGKKAEFEEGAVKEGFTKEHADDIFEIMIPFANYGFNKSHAAAYTVLAYRTGYLKCHYAAEFMAANLTNEITSTDTLPVYIEEAKKMGIPVDAPDVNRSDVNFDVVDGHIVFGLRGIKGMGEGAAAAIVHEREANGPFESFSNFIERCMKLKETSTDENGHLLPAKNPINKKAIEVLIKTGGFDHLDKNRATLLLNYEQVIAYEEKKNEDSAYGQASLFEDAGIKEYADYTWDECEEMPKMELLNMEKDLIGCFVSGHPLDDYRKVIENCATCSSQNIDRCAKETKAESEALAASGKPWLAKKAGRTLIAIGMVNNIRPIMTKKGTRMAFGKLADFKGEMDLTFFPKTWELLESKIHPEGVYAFKGKVDGSRETPSFIVDSLEDINALETKAVTSLHIQVENGFKNERDILKLTDFLLGAQGNCNVFFHVDIGGKMFTVRATSEISTPSTPEFIQSVKDLPYVHDAWID